MAKRGPQDRARELLELIDHAVQPSGVPVGPGTRAALGVWLDRLEEWNARIDLTAARSADELVDLMLGDALWLVGRIAAGARLIDVGTGAGAPGLALALLRSDLPTTLVEPLGKRVSFLRTVIGALGRTDIAIERARGEAFRGQRTWDFAVSRATLAAPVWLELASTLVPDGGSVAVLLAKDAPPALPGAVVECDETYAWPLTATARRAVVYRIRR